ncbi:MAG: TonB-dependent receptor plug domain-containing protein [Gemmatimonadota bacterium]|nr:TonB-dependent receptor plug domain-containing protein [Gemmatimonadota bacterium]
MRYARMLLVALVVVVAACASAGGNGAQRPSRNQNQLSQEEIRDSQYSSLYDVVRALRPGWLRTRGQISFSDPDAGQVVVYLNGVRAGGADYLREVNAREVLSLEFLNETDASARFGLRQGGGAAIVIHTMDRG